MLLANPSIHPEALRSLLVDEFGADEAPVFVSGAGGDSWCYRAGEWWVSVRRDRQGHSPQCYEAARELRDVGLDFVLAPARGRSGAVVHEVDGAPAVVFRFVDGRELPSNRATPTQAARIGQMIESLHTRTVVTALPAETFVLPFADELADGLALALAGAEGAGPYGERVTALVRANVRAIDALRSEMTLVQHACRAGTATFVLTHGEPVGNVMVRPDGELLLMDWGELRWGPPERDLFAVGEVGLDLSGRHELVRYYELLWVLGEIAEYVARFAHPHPGSAEDAEKWDELLRNLALP